MSVTGPANWPAPQERSASATGGAPADPWATRADVRAGLYVVAVLAVVGAVLGVLWQWWSPSTPVGYVIAPHAVQPDETEAFIAGDGRFAVISMLTGLLAGTAVWFATRLRGPVTALALGVGGVAGALLTEFVGHVLAGGHGSAATGTLIAHLPLSVHLGGLRVLEATIAVLVYGLFVSFAAADDLGRPELVTSVGGSVGDGDQTQHGWSHSDAAGALQQPYLPPQ